MATILELQARIGEQLRTLRIASGYSQAELASRANVSLSSLTHLERGEGSSLGTLIPVVRALGREDWLEALDPISPGASPMELLRESRRERKVPRRVR